MRWLLLLGLGLLSLARGQDGQAGEGELADFLAAATAAYEAQDYGAAAEALTGAMQVDPYFFDADAEAGMHATQASHLAAAEEWESAIGEMALALVFKPADPDLSAALGQWLIAAGDLPAADRLLRAAVKADRAAAAPRSVLAALHAARGEYERAVVVYERVARRVRSDPEASAFVHAELGASLLALGDVDSAAAAFGMGIGFAEAQEGLLSVDTDVAQVLYLAHMAPLLLRQLGVDASEGEEVARRALAVVESPAFRKLEQDKASTAEVHRCRQAFRGVWQGWNEGVPLADHLGAVVVPRVVSVLSEARGSPRCGLVTALAAVRSSASLLTMAAAEDQALAELLLRRYRSVTARPAAELEEARLLHAAQLLGGGLAGQVFIGASQGAHQLIRLAPHVTIGVWEPVLDVLGGLKGGWAPGLVEALSEWTREATAALLGAGVAADTPDHDGNTPMHLTARYSLPGHLDALRQLLDAAEPLGVNAAGRTPLHVAALHGNAAAVALLRPRCNESAVDATGRTAAELSRLSGSEETAALFGQALTLFPAVGELPPPGRCLLDTPDERTRLGLVATYEVLPEDFSMDLPLLSNWQHGLQEAGVSLADLRLNVTVSDNSFMPRQFQRASAHRLSLQDYDPTTLQYVYEPLRRGNPANLWAAMDLPLPHMPEEVRLFVGPVETGLPPHVGSRGEWTLLVHGRLRWFLFPPSEARVSSKTVRAWLADDYEPGSAWELVQEAGQVVFVPSEWSAAYVALCDSAAVAFWP